MIPLPRMRALKHELQMRSLALIPCYLRLDITSKR